MFDKRPSPEMLANAAASLALLEDYRSRVMGNDAALRAAANDDPVIAEIAKKLNENLGFLRANDPNNFPKDVPENPFPTGSEVNVNVSEQRH